MTFCKYNANSFICTKFRPPIFFSGYTPKFAVGLANAPDCLSSFMSMPAWNLIAPLFSWIIKVYQVPSTKIVLPFLIKKLASLFFVKMNCRQLQVLFIWSTSDWQGLAYWIQKIIFQNQCYICLYITYLWLYFPLFTIEIMPSG